MFKIFSTIFHLVDFIWNKMSLYWMFWLFDRERFIVILKMLVSKFCDIFIIFSLPWHGCLEWLCFICHQLAKWFCDHNTLQLLEELGWRSGSVNGLPSDNPGFDSRWVRCINRASRPSQGTVNVGAVSKWPCCQRDVKHNQPNYNYWWL